MQMRPWMRIAVCAVLSLVAAGCVSDEVVYVDEQGNELAVDENGQPLAPPADLGGVTEAPPALAEPSAPRQGPVPMFGPTDAPSPIVPPASSAQPKPVAVPEAAAGTQPDPNWDLPPAGAARSPLDGPPVKPKPGEVQLRVPPKPSPKILERAAAKKAKAKKKKLDSSAGLDLPPAG